MHLHTKNSSKKIEALLTLKISYYLRDRERGGHQLQGSSKIDEYSI